MTLASLAVAYRGQSNLLALGAALVILSVALVAAIAIVDASFMTGERDATERAIATGTAERLVSADSPVAVRQNVLDTAAVEGFDDERLATTLPAATDRAIAVSIDDERIAAVGEPTSGTTIRRLVLVESTERVERTPALSAQQTTVPVRTDAVELTIEPTAGPIQTVRVNDRVALHDESGLNGTYEVNTARYETATLQFDGDGTLSTGDLTLVYEVTTDRKAVLSVTVDERKGDWVEDDAVPQHGDAPGSSASIASPIRATVGLATDLPALPPEWSRGERP